MKLNPDCVRDILFAVEETVDYYTMFEYVAVDGVHEKLKKYSHDEVVYHIHQCNLSGLLHGCDINISGAYVRIEDLSPAGHEFLSNTRKNAVWEKVKKVGDEIGSDSLRSLAAIAGQMIRQLIKDNLPVT